MKLALIGTGKIIEDALFAMEPVETIERTAIFARPHSRDKAEKFAKQYAIKEVYTDYEELLEKTEADHMGSNNFVCAGSSCCWCGAVQTDP